MLVVGGSSPMDGGRAGSVYRLMSVRCKRTLLSTENEPKTNRTTKLTDKVKFKNRPSRQLVVPRKPLLQPRKRPPRQHKHIKRQRVIHIEPLCVHRKHRLQHMARPP